MSHNNFQFPITLKMLSVSSLVDLRDRDGRSPMYLRILIYILTASWASSSLSVRDLSRGCLIGSDEYFHNKLESDNVLADFRFVLLLIVAALLALASLKETNIMSISIYQYGKHCYGTNSYQSRTNSFQSGMNSLHNGMNSYQGYLRI